MRSFEAARPSARHVFADADPNEPVNPADCVDVELVKSS
jgi:hypothetical protein